MPSVDYIKLSTTGPTGNNEFVVNIREKIKNAKIELKQKPDYHLYLLSSINPNLGRTDVPLYAYVHSTYLKGYSKSLFPYFIGKEKCIITNNIDAYGYFDRLLISSPNNDFPVIGNENVIYSHI
jgi:hypothetical protein